jgi:hypothetical protein
MQTAITEQSINPANIKEKDRPPWPIASEKITPNNELMLMRSDVAIGMALSHGNVNAMI